MNNTRYPRLLASLALAIGAIPLTVNAGSCFVWRVTNTKAPCYLVGTLHALKGHDYPLPAGYEQALRDSKRLLFEIRPNPPSEYFTKFDRAATYPKGQYIQNHVHSKTWEIIRVDFTRASLIGRSGRIGNCYVEHGIEQLRPWAIASIFYGIPGFSDVYDTYGVDNY